jgi:hypothetical protein
VGGWSVFAVRGGCKGLNNKEEKGLLALG